MSREMLPTMPVELLNDEIDARLSRLRAKMADDQIDLMVLTAQNNIEYFSGHRSLSWTSNARPMLFLVTHDKAILIASRTEERNYLTVRRPFAACYYQGFLEQAVELAREKMRKLVRPRAIAAIDYGSDMYGRGSLALVRAMQDELHNPVQEGADLLWSIRMIKSRFEADMKKKSFLIANWAFDAALAEAHLGITEIEMFRTIQSRIVLNGAERADPFPLIFSRGEFIYNRWPTERSLAPGDYVWADFRSTYAGYPADRNRIARAEEAQPWERKVYKSIRDLTIALASGIRPGMTGGDAFAMFRRLWGEAGLGPVYARAARIGHGGGLDLTEPPSIMEGSKELIAEGMILHLEPKLEIEGAVFQCEEAIYVGERENEFLTELCPQELPIIA